MAIKTKVQLRQSINSYLEAKAEEKYWKDEAAIHGENLREFMKSLGKEEFSFGPFKLTYKTPKPSSGYKKDYIDALVESGEIPKDVIEQARSFTDPSPRLNVSKRGKK